MLRENRTRVSYEGRAMTHHWHPEATARCATCSSSQHKNAAALAALSA